MQIGEKTPMLCANQQSAMVPAQHQYVPTELHGIKSQLWDHWNDTAVASDIVLRLPYT
jgi:hypothetical protein